MTRIAFTLTACFALLPGVLRADATSPWLTAVRAHDTVTVQRLIARGADVNAADARGTTALHVAAGFGYADLVRELIAAGADLNARGPLGKTPLLLAIQEDHADLAQQLLEAGADPSLRSDVGASALSLARGYGHQRLIAAIDRLQAPAAPSAPLPWMPVSLAAILGGLTALGLLPSRHRASTRIA